MVAIEFTRELHSRFGIDFDHVEILEEAFTHSSYANEHRELGVHDNERLEFLGDAVLELTVSEYLFKKYPDVPEGKLTRMRAAAVQTRSFARFSREAHFDRYIRLGHGEENAGARQRDTLLEDLFEAFCGALFLDQGRQAVIKFCEQIIWPHIDAGEFEDTRDFKTKLQERLQRGGDVDIEYNLLSEEDAANNQRLFTVAVTADGRELGRGTGTSKKHAEQDAAHRALATLA
ncbi:ribonuclease III [Lacticaseibacillus thailandensis]|uniref:Ribonuclease 3 n=1 Tax=Lacticaseibacillus thailandensis DSM 22698 = JCM 13996 TaxID=1423810 RepID=A0A0R2C8W7_9LACO|nr:ribonuclease III [Lacticaseibacillus thailandensis]KRM88237.1 ribonuclease iii [Lacticaseibacillus thailandensis DSM 22698 = JCM 13996]